MKTSVIEVRDMLSVLSVLGLEKRIGDVPGVESVTVNYAAGKATVRYDETRLTIADIKSGVREDEDDVAGPADASGGASYDGRAAPEPLAPASAVPALNGPEGLAAPDSKPSPPPAVDAKADPVVTTPPAAIGPQAKEAPAPAPAPQPTIGAPARLRLSRGRAAKGCWPGFATCATVFGRAMLSRTRSLRRPMPLRRRRLRAPHPLLEAAAARATRRREGPSRWTL